MEENGKVTVEAPLFVLFAEFLGYSSRFLEDCESWCKGKIPPIYLQMAIRVEANDRSVGAQLGKSNEERSSIDKHSCQPDFLGSEETG